MPSWISVIIQAYCCRRTVTADHCVLNGVHLPRVACYPAGFTSIKFFYFISVLAQQCPPARNSGDPSKSSFKVTDIQKITRRLLLLRKEMNVYSHFVQICVK